MASDLTLPGGIASELTVVNRRMEETGIDKEEESRERGEKK